MDTGLDHAFQRGCSLHCLKKPGDDSTEGKPWWDVILVQDAPQEFFTGSTICPRDLRRAIVEVEDNYYRAHERLSGITSVVELLRAENAFSAVIGRFERFMATIYKGGFGCGWKDGLIEISLYGYLTKEKYDALVGGRTWCFSLPPVEFEKEGKGHAFVEALNAALDAICAPA